MEALIQPVLHDADARPELTARNATLWSCRAAAPRLRDAARGLLRALLADYLEHRPAELRLDFTPGQPARVAARWHGLPISIGISYAAGLAVVGLCPGARIGVDVTEIAPIPDWDAVAHLYLGTARAVRLSRMSAPERERGFALAWAELEARGKCLGLGLEEWSPARERQLYAASIELTTNELPASHTASHANLMLALAIGGLSG